jgi:hypothetical protein
MRTYPILRDDGSLLAFEISNTWIAKGTIRRLLCSVPGVSDVQATTSGEQRALFSFHGEPCEVWEPFGDNSRYWVGPQDAANSTLDLSLLRCAFETHAPLLIRLFRGG